MTLQQQHAQETDCGHLNQSLRLAAPARRQRSASARPHALHSFEFGRAGRQRDERVN